MAAVWRNALEASNQVIVDPRQNYTFRWVSYLAAGETQTSVQIKSKPAGTYPVDVVQLMYDDPNISTAWTTRVSTNTASTMWTIPANTFGAGTVMFAVRILTAPTNEWTPWVIHKVDFDHFTTRNNHRETTTRGWNLPAGFVDGQKYGIKIEAISAAGITNESTEAQFDAWETNQYVLKGGVINAVPEYHKKGTIVARTKR